jgi:predicted nucleic acid-binding protein
MKCLFDVSTLVAFGLTEHEFHDRVTTWVRSLRSRGILDLATCSITELGFVRILAQTPTYGFTVDTARSLLLRIKARHPETFTFIPDDQDIEQIPGWVKYPKQITDGHLVQLATAHGAVLATLDTGIPGAYLIPRKN